VLLATVCFYFLFWSKAIEKSFVIDEIRKAEKIDTTKSFLLCFFFFFVRVYKEQK
jgi:hypothetical protein